jgi:hypothetical protein
LIIRGKITVFDGCRIGKQAQQLMDSQLQADWSKLLDQIAGALNPIHDEIFQRFPMHYYWTTYQSEWATDIVFRAAEDLRRLIRYWYITP